ncbi:hypothetical protein [Nocardia cyriacigeorgica]|uniref:hypothetical protein n=1 Tax=Nocardia cyriacigeorgica TaxID=135487 RepID=UPI00245497E8|nr:hypothetical protein [Nocardia cyriacigeorgica]
MTHSAEELEAQIAELRAEVRRAAASGDRTTARRLRAELRRAEDSWDAVVLGAAPEAPVPPTSTVPVREHVHRALTLLSVPSAPKLVLAVHTGFFSGELVPARLTSLRRDEERSFRAAPFARPYYICSALTTDLLAPARGLFAVSTWPLAQRMVGPLSPRVDLLKVAIRLAEHVSAHQHSEPSGRRVLWQLTTSIPGIDGTPDRLDPAAVIEAARGELAVHIDEDTHQREQAAQRATRQLDDPAAQLFGTRLGVAARRSEVG